MKHRSTALFACVILGSLALTTVVQSTHASAAPPATPAGGQTLSTPSGVHSPTRKSLSRKGTIVRTAPRAIDVGVTDSTSGDAAATPSPEAVARVLSLPENASLKSWYEAQQDFLPPRMRVRAIPFAAWTDDQPCIVRREGDTKYLRAGCSPATYRVSATIDQAWADAFERYFGFPEHMLDALAYRPGDGSLTALEYAITQSFAQHGISANAQRIAPDYQWILDRTVPEVRQVAAAVIDAYWSGLREQPTARQRIEALASYVQNAVPYRKVDDGTNDIVKDGKSRCGLRTPAETLLDGGDCDSKSLLLATLIRSVDTDTPLALIFCMNAGTPHMCMAVGCEGFAGEQTIQVRGTPMVLVETTSDWDVGHVSGKVDIKDAEAQPLR